ncbi:FAD-dependent oxidoreductase [Oceanospirillum sanctuarii]|uniref:FAD-dependent oxidoreductase n=1 Tax=Oceanospirillum sanctuarii TaxID=1434821 RepID=UPI000A35F8F8|nr:FAD-dependent oxidoreductase [Oceanospirillum sanctuarii]
MPLQIAIVGSGPAGCFIAELLSRKIEDCQIDIIERLPSLFGLVRAGVAPDHQGTKNVTRQFEKTLEKDNIRVLANLNVGPDISYDELKSCYDLVVIATGASEDRMLNIPGEDSAGVYGSSHFVGWYNGHPASHQNPPELKGPSVAIIGHGNVALDIARLLAKTSNERAETDICAPAMSQLDNSEVSDIYLIGRGTPEQSKFTPPELAELKALSAAVPVISNTRIPETPSSDLDPREARAKQMNLDLFREFAENASNPVLTAGKTRIHLLFNHSPVAVASENGRIKSLKLKHQAEQASDELALPVDTLISAIGYRSREISSVPFDTQQGRIQHENGLIEPGVYATGWCRRGPNGVIPTNRADALEISKRILADLDSGQISAGKSGRVAMDNLIEAKQLKVLSYQDWKTIDQAEQDRAQGNKPREKFLTEAEMLQVLSS